MKLLVTYIFILTTTLISLSFFCTEAETRMNSQSLEIKLNKQYFRVGDKLTISFIFKNNSDKKIKIFAGWRLYPSNYFEIFDINNNLQHSITHILLENKFLTSKDLVNLNPGEENKFIIQGVLKEGKVTGINNKMHDGLFIDFGYEAIVLKNEGQYRIRGKWQIDPGDFISNEHHQIPNDVWFGKIITSFSEFVVSKKK